MTHSLASSAPEAPRFQDREQAGQALAHALAGRPPDAHPRVVLALPRGGVVVAAPVVRALACPRDVLIVRKVGAPGQPELAVAAVAERLGAAGPVSPGEGSATVRVVDAGVATLTGASGAWIDAESQREADEIERRQRAWLAGRARVPLQGATVFLVDDGIATGTTVKAALRALRAAHPARIVLAVPVAPPEVVRDLQPLVDELVCLSQPQPFSAVGLHYRRFPQVGDEEVRAFLEVGTPGVGELPGLPNRSARAAGSSASH